MRSQRVVLDFCVFKASISVLKYGPVQGHSACQRAVKEQFSTPVRLDSINSCIEVWTDAEPPSQLMHSQRVVLDLCAPEPNSTLLLQPMNTYLSNECWATYLAMQQPRTNQSMMLNLSCGRLQSISNMEALMNTIKYSVPLLTTFEQSKCMGIDTSKPKPPVQNCGLVLYQAS